MKYTHILMDLDKTVFDFDYAERAAFFMLCSRYGIKADEDIYLLYKGINDQRWKQYEDGLIDKDEVLVLRFKDFFTKVGMTSKDFDSISEDYIDLLIENTKLYEGAEEILNRLGRRFVLDAITNASTDIQMRKLKITGTENMFHKLFISEQIGFPKPAKEFFDYIFSYYGNVPRENFLVVGDSLSADIKGACLSGIDSVWLSYKRPLTGIFKPSYIVENIKDLSLFFKEDI